MYQSGFNILALLVAADEFLLDQIVNLVQEHLILRESNWLKENFIMVLSTVSKFQNCKKIQNYITEIIELPINSKSGIHDLLDIANELDLIHLIDHIQELVNPEPLLFELENFPTLERDIVLKFIKRDDLVIEEVDVWKYLVKWATAQYSSLSEDVSVNANVNADVNANVNADINSDINTWGENEFTLFKKIINSFIPYIRFCEMTRYEFYYHVMPYEKVLPENFYKSLIAYFMINLKSQNIMLQPRNGLISIDSTIIKRKNARIIVKWIKGVTVFTKKLSYEFTCVYRATRWEFGYKKFIKELKSSFSSKLLLIKIKDSDIIIGGCINYWKSEKESNFHIPSKVRCLWPVEESEVLYSENFLWIAFYFGNDYLQLFGHNGCCSILNDCNFIVEEIELFRVYA
ncbi:11694_t:CDS:2 [Gigaspora margarita]|uniref:11694_t:CDS:1 n=1 Tax=Gigaspora margarita TaxID=4874 RepID=A0ABN7UY98_GIGMA|nr:11694_t:CDS:2 [Gigaspora margarita]